MILKFGPKQKQLEFTFQTRIPQKYTEYICYGRNQKIQSQKSISNLNVNPLWFKYKFNYLSNQDQFTLLLCQSKVHWRMERTINVLPQIERVRRRRRIKINGSRFFTQFCVILPVKSLERLNNSRSSQTSLGLTRPIRIGSTVFQRPRVV